MAPGQLGPGNPTIAEYQTNDLVGKTRASCYGKPLSGRQVPVGTTDAESELLGTTGV